MPRYSSGTITVSGTAVTGTNTNWTDQIVVGGDILEVPLATAHVRLELSSVDHLNQTAVLARAYAGPAITDAGYFVSPENAVEAIKTVANRQTRLSDRYDNLSGLVDASGNIIVNGDQYDLIVEAAGNADRAEVAALLAVLQAIEPTRADLTANLGAYADGDVILVEVDETNGDEPTIYRIVSGSPVRGYSPATSSAVAAVDAKVEVFYQDFTALDAETLAGLQARYGASGTVILTARDRGQSYSVDLSQIAAFDITTTGGVELAVLPGATGELFASAFGVVVDGTNQGPALQAFFNKKHALGLKGVLPAGVIRITSLVRADDQTGNAITSDHYLRSEGKTVLSFSSGAQRLLLLDVGRKKQTSLSANASYLDTFIDVADADTVSIGDLIRIENDEVPSPLRPYQKEHMRRVAGVDIGGGSGGSDRVFIDQPLVWFFTVGESTVVDFYPPVKVRWDDISLKCENLGGIQLRYFAGGTIKNMDIEGPAIFDDTATDPCSIARCDGVIFDGGEHSYCRYSLNVVACRAIIIKNISFFGVRHPDFNSLCEDSRIEDCRGIWTQGITQCHASLNISFARIRDHIDKDTPELSGVDIRCVGGYAEDITVTTGHGVKNLDTNGIELNAPYEYMYTHYPPRRLTRVDAPDFIANSRYTGKLIIDGGRFHSIVQSGYDVTEVIIKSPPVLTNPRDSEINCALTGSDGVVPLVAFADFGRAIGVSPLSVTTASQTNPVVLTVTAHGLSNGDVVRVAGIAGMTQINGHVGSVTVVDPDTLSLNGLDGTSFTAYTSGGTVTEQSSYTTVDIATNPSCGPDPTLRYSATIAENVSGFGGSYSIPLKLIHDRGTSGKSRTGGTMAVRVTTRDDFAEFRFNFYTLKESTSLFKLAPAAEIGTSFGGELITVAASNVQPHFATQQAQEGSTGRDQEYMLLQFDITTDGDDILERVDLAVLEN